jgi:hypothetical protein
LRFEEGIKMKKLINFKRVLYFFSIIMGIIFLQSCVVYQPYSAQQVTVPDIVKMSKDGYSSKSIIKEIRQSHSYYTLKADQLSKLRNEGVQDSVINYMEKTHIDAVRGNQQMNDSYYGWPGDYGWYGGFGYGWPYGGWGWGPTIIYSEHRSFGGGFHGGSHGGRR